jgi:hypothetical protein
MLSDDIESIESSSIINLVNVNSKILPLFLLIIVRTSLRLVRLLLVLACYVNVSYLMVVVVVVPVWLAVGWLG